MLVPRVENGFPLFTLDPPTGAHTDCVRATKLLTGVAGAAWLGSWYLMHKEITHWHHVRPSLRFNSDIGPDAHPGMPLKLLYVVCAAAPLTVIVASRRLWNARRVPAQ
jgi:hypothetical protein